MRKLLLLTVFLFSVQSAGKAAQHFENRPYGWTIIYGSSLSALQGVPLSELALFAFDSTTASWHPIPFQIDEVGEDSFFGGDDGLLDGVEGQEDELVFLPRDAGDKAWPHNWPDGFDYNSAVYEFQLTDSTTGESAFAYLFRFPNGAPPSPNPYGMSYDPERDAVVSRFYEAVFDSNITVHDVRILSAAGGDSVDLVDRQKSRIKGRIGWAPYEANEQDDFPVTGIDYVVGPVRVIRRVHSKFLGSIDFYFTGRFYPFGMLVGSGTHEITSSMGIQLIRQSLDLSSQAVGMRFYNAHNDGVLIDGSPDQVDKTLDVPGLNWFMVTGESGTIVSIVSVPPMGDVQTLYYRDDAQGGTGDGTKETGDGKSYGDAGVLFKATSGGITGSFASLATTMFFLPPNQTPAVAESLTSALRRPLTRFVRPLDLSAVAVSEPNQLPGTIELFPAYPNPFNSSTQVRFSLPRAERVRLAVYDLVGHQVTVLVDRRLGAGTHRVVWSGVDTSHQPVPSGLYFVRLQAGPVSRTRKVLLLK